VLSTRHLYTSSQYAIWCVPCAHVLLKYSSVADQHQDIASRVAEEDPRLAQQHQYASKQLKRFVNHQGAPQRNTRTPRKTPRINTTAASPRVTRSRARLLGDTTGTALPSNGADAERDATVSPLPPTNPMLQRTDQAQVTFMRSMASLGNKAQNTTLGNRTNGTRRNYAPIGSQSDTLPAVSSFFFIFAFYLVPST